MRQNSGGSGFLADQMAAYFFDKELVLGNTVLDKKLDDFFDKPWIVSICQMRACATAARWQC